MGNLIRKPSELEAKQTISVLIYGQPGAGKTTLGMSAPNPVLFDYDGGVNRINAAHQGLTVQVRSWEDTQAALDEIRTEHPDVQTIVIDTVGKMLDYMSEYIMRTNTRMRKTDGTLSLQGYGIRKAMFVEFIRQTSIIGKNVIFLAHEKETKGADGETLVKRPEVGGSSANDLMKELDLVGYLQMIGRSRTICFNPTEWFYAKNTCNLEPEIKVPVLVDARGRAGAANDFLSGIIARYGESQAERRELTERYEKLMEAVETAALAAKTPEDLNAVKESLLKAEPIFNSRIAGADRLARRAQEIGAVYDKINECYVAA